MKIAIISDIHDNLVNLEKCLSWCAENKIENIICCGDVTNSETLGVLGKIVGTGHCPIQVYLVRGNMEIYDEDELFAYDNIINGGRVAVWEIGGRIIGACHEPFLIKEVITKAEVVGTGHCPVRTPDIIFYGHTHKPWIEERPSPSARGGHPSQGGELKIVNPGTLGGVFSRASFAIYDTEKNEVELKILDLL